MLLHRLHITVSVSFYEVAVARSDCCLTLNTHPAGSSANSDGEQPIAQLKAAELQMPDLVATNRQEPGHMLLLKNKGDSGPCLPYGFGCKQTVAVRLVAVSCCIGCI
jgi:hypothetical protein